jgi:RAD51-like protein 1
LNLNLSLLKMNCDGQVKAKLETRGVRSAEDALKKSELDIIELIDVSFEKANKALHQIAKGACPKPTNALLLKEKSTGRIGENFIKTGVTTLDEALLGGITIGTITEFVAPAGSGKTQMCLGLVAQTCAPKNFGGLDGSVIFIDTEQTFSSNRLAEIAKKRFPEVYDKEYYRNGNNASTFGERDKDAEKRLEKLLAEKVFVVTPQSLQELKVRIENLKPALTQSNAKLIVIDSVARLARAEGASGICPSSGESLVKRQNILSAIAAALKRHAEQLNVAVVVTNQVTTNTNSNSTYFNSSDPAKANMLSRDSLVAAALGTKWAHCVNVRISMSGTIDNTTDGKREMKVIKSPRTALSRFFYRINAVGCTSIELEKQKQ